MSDGVHFHGNITAGTFNNAVHGDVNNNYGHQNITTGLDAQQVSALVRALRAELDASALPERAKDAVHDRLDEVDRGVATGAGREGVGARLREIRDVLAGAGGAVTAGGGLWSALKALATAVGLGL
jgi:hypothetical protein